MLHSYIVLHVVWALSDLSSGTPETFQLNDVSVQSLLISLTPILGFMLVNVLQQGM